MHQFYEDILSRIAEAPTWFDERGVPRYCAFTPNRLANIYAKECALMEICCQACHHKFVVAIDGARARATASSLMEPDNDSALADLVRTDAIHYGDPPNIRCCDAGPTMNTIPLRVLEFWHRSVKLKPGTRIVEPGTGYWERDGALEIEIDRRRYLERHRV